jgi:hypothetical protein
LRKRKGERKGEKKDGGINPPLHKAREERFLASLGMTELI